MLKDNFGDLPLKVAFPGFPGFSLAFVANDNRTPREQLVLNSRDARNMVEPSKRGAVQHPAVDRVSVSSPRSLLTPAPFAGPDRYLAFFFLGAMVNF